MLDPMEASLRELTVSLVSGKKREARSPANRLQSFTGRILSSYEPVDSATIERLRTMAESHHRLTG